MDSKRSPIARLAAQSGVVRGTLWVVAASVLFAGMPVSVRILSNDMPAVEIVFFRSALAMMFMTLYFAWRGFHHLRTTVLGLHVYRSVLNFIGMVMWFYGLGLMPLAQAVAVQFTMPLFIVLMAVLFLGESVGRRRLAATAAGFIGVLVVLRPGRLEIGLPALAVLASAAFYAGAVTVIKILTRSDNAAAITFYTNMIMTVFAAVPTALLWRTPGWDDVPALVVLGLCGTAAPYCVTQGLRLMDASVVASLDFLRLPFTALAAFVLFAEAPDLWTWVGALVIFAATIYSARGEAAAARRSKPRTEA